MPEPVVTVTHTIMDGPVVRWYRDLTAAELNSCLLSASRTGVMIHGEVYLHDLPAEWITAAELAHKSLKAGADVSGLATHVVLTDSADPARPELPPTRDQFAALLDAIKEDR
ncbi:hypothetical protein [Actinomadura sp. SCN-SB]|uniref:hypothetical protein n=1 Tax=Actinomadura sp. SCN-SB TaxID=3373092 RepID=UPI003752D13D